MADETINSGSSTTPASPVDPTAGGQGATSSHTEEAKSRFNAALDEAKAGANALKEEAVTRANTYRDQAVDSGEHWASDAKQRAGGLATEGKARASGALLGLSKVVDENAPMIDENLGPKYGDYARNASRSIRDTADALDRKSLEELGDDARSFVRDQPGMAVGLAALAGFFFARIFRK